MYLCFVLYYYVLKNILAEKALQIYIDIKKIVVMNLQSKGFGFESSKTNISPACNITVWIN